MEIDAEQELACDYVARIVAATGLSATELARRAGVAPSTLTRIYPQPQVKHTLSARTIAKIDRQFPGFRPPGLEARAVTPRPAGTLSDHLGSFAGFPNQAAPAVPVYAPRLARTGQRAFQDGKEIIVEALEHDGDDIVGYVKRPPGVDPLADVKAAYVAGTAMEPRLRPGETAFFDLRRPPRTGDEVIVVLSARAPEEGHRILLRTLVSQNANEIELQQYEPPLRFTVPVEEIAHLWRVIPWMELVGTHL